MLLEEKCLYIYKHNLIIITIMMIYKTKFDVIKKKNFVHNNVLQKCRDIGSDKQEKNKKIVSVLNSIWQVAMKESSLFFRVYVINIQNASRLVINL